MHAACTLQPSQRGTLQARNILSVDTVARPDGFVLGPLPGSVPGEGLPWNLLVLTRPLDDELEDAFADLQDDVADEAVGDDDVADALVNVAALDVANEALTQRTGVEQGMGFLGKVVTLGFLRADVHEADGRLFAL